MKNLILSCLLLVALASFLPLGSAAQCVYTYTAVHTAAQTGSITEPANFNVTSNTFCPPSGPSITTAQNIIIDGIAMYLDGSSGSYDLVAGRSIIITNGGSLTIRNGATLNILQGGGVNVGENGDLYVSAGGTINGAGNSLEVDSRGGITIDAGGFIIGGNIQLGNGRDNFRATNLIVNGPLAASNVPLPSSVQVDQLNVDKATVTVGVGASITTKCNLILKNTVLQNNGTILVNGNLDLFPGGNVADCGSGLLTVRGCAFASPGSINQLAATCGSPASPKICVAQNNVFPCPGSVFGVACAAPDNRLTNTAACRPLPVELISFVALPTNRQTVLLRWATASEKNNASFTVERSADGKTFSTIRTVPGAGNTQARTNYELADEHPMSGTGYYRLRQNDFDGASTYSLVRVVAPDGIQGNSLEVYPGRTAQEWVISSTLPAETLLKGKAVQVFDALGRMQPVPCVADAALPGRWTLDLHTLPAGIYIVRLLTSSGPLSQRIAK
ncbi:T9SS type A sorting domain-containing protein [Hymenobacter sp. BT770]|uniref:T9SS type A sorting domain-containing protein n=1 Tax=Hymenobacter sp. BT770 TaxID=2886942 RepID=UPI001D12F469|nr:T9SS type A sorting domain-containing protein [Hymenobacter sp. BT770]MCC3154536.1 T9SS type A sorting domain-containing protein [Hymenobacter sp. BT770]MDO3416400.1 T9SS type A sorting domain-containing protein [Hymenobacter sp. BT770]